MPSRSAALACAVCISQLAAACATTPGNDLEAQRDPLEPFNRGVYSFNKGVDKVVLKPAAQGYRAVVPTAAQRGVTNAFNNVDEPLSFINALLQGKLKVAGNALGRFVINTVLGVGGLADHATDMGLIRQQEDFGQTLAVWGVNSGPYLMLPLIGPSNFRDGVGFGVEFFGDPYRIAVQNSGLSSEIRWGLTGLELLDTRSQLMSTADILLLGSADEYATVKAAYLQLRQSEIYDGAYPDEDYDDMPPEGAGVAENGAAGSTEAEVNAGPPAAPGAGAARPNASGPAAATAPEPSPPAPPASAPSAAPAPETSQPKEQQSEPADSGQAPAQAPEARPDRR